MMHDLMSFVEVRKVWHAARLLGLAGCSVVEIRLELYCAVPFSVHEMRTCVSMLRSLLEMACGVGPILMFPVKLHENIRSTDGIKSPPGLLQTCDVSRAARCSC